MRVPKLPFGWMKATVVPRDPGRGSLSIGVAPAATIEASAAALLDRLGDRRVGPGGGGQLDVAVGYLHQRLLDAVGLDDLAVGHLGPEGLGVVRHGGVQVAHGDGHVIDLGQQHVRILSVMAVPVVDAAGQSTLEMVAEPRPSMELRRSMLPGMVRPWCRPSVGTG